ncbi:MAG: hypothetical protein AABY15_03185 [Nanoarchaeota archaeon]
MISAKEAKELTLRGIESKLDRIEILIKSAAKSGNSQVEVEVDYLTNEVKKHLKNAGYSLAIPNGGQEGTIYWV